MTGPLYRIGGFCSRHHWPVIGAWIALAIALVVIGQASGSKTSENLTLPGTGSTQATELLEENLPEQAYGSNPLVLEAPAGKKLTEAPYAKAVAETDSQNTLTQADTMPAWRGTGQRQADLKRPQ